MLNLTLSGRMLFVYIQVMERTEIGSFWPPTANTKPTLIRCVLHHSLPVLSHSHHSHPEH